MKVGTLSDQQAAFLLAEIARTARGMACIGRILEHEELGMDEELGIAVGCLSRRAGWLADAVLKHRFAGMEAAEARSQEQWDLPPVFYTVWGA